MIFGPGHALETTGSRPVSAMGLVVLHVVAYGAFCLVLRPEFNVAAVVLGVLLVLISMADFRRFEIPDTLSALVAVSGLLNLAFLPPMPPWDHIAAGVGFPLLLYTVGHVYLRFRGIHGLGLGDVKLAVGLGFWLGIQGSVWTLLAASLSGIAALVAIAVVRRKPLDELSASGVAFAPFLCLSAWVFWLQGSVH